MTTAAIYVRVSSSQQEEDGTSLETQEQHCREYAARCGYLVDEEYVYREVHTGVELWERPKLTALREAVRRRDVHAVVAYSIDRLSRDPVHLGVVISEAEHRDATVEFVTEPLDGSPEGQLIRFVRGYAAKVEHEKIKERTMRGRLARVHSGKPLSAPRPPYGFAWNTDKSGYVADPLTAPVVQRIFRQSGEGATLRRIVNDLNNDGIPTVKGGPLWHPSAVFEILKRRAYTGEVTALRYKTTKVRGKVQRVERPESEQVRLPEGTAPALIDRETFEVIQTRLRLNQERSARSNRYPEAALLRGGFAKCGYCGRSMVICNRGTTYGCNSGYLGRCAHHKMAIKDLDGILWEKVSGILLRPEIIRAELAAMRTADPSAVDLDATDRALSEIARRQANVARTIAQLEPADAEPLVRELAALGAQKRQLEAERTAVLEWRAGWEAAQHRLADLEAWCRSVASRLDEADYTMRRLALDALGVEVRVYHRRHSPRYAITASIPLDIPVVSETDSRFNSASRRRPAW